MEALQHSPNVARFDRVALRYGQGAEIFRNISLELPAGSFHFLVGRSGAGKTSLLRLLYLALRPTSGSLQLFGTDVEQASRTSLQALRRRIGIVFQDFRLLPQLSLRDNIALPLRVAGRSEEAVAGDVDRMLARIGLLPLARERPQALSGGQQQLAAIARAVISQPRLLIADEPTASVDEALALRLVRLFQELNRLSTTVIIATHNERLADRFDHPRLRLQNGLLTFERRSPAASPPHPTRHTGAMAGVA
jgi:cell division transport system ATP-binding protein